MNSIVAQERIIALRKKRSAQDLRFKYYGFIAMCLALAVLVFLLYSIFSRGFSAFQKTTILLEINYDQDVLKLTPDSTDQEIEKGKFFKVKKNALNNVFENLSKSDAKLIKKLLILIGKKRILLPMPLPLAKVSARFFEIMPKPLLTRDQLKLLKYDNVSSSEESSSIALLDA